MTCSNFNVGKLVADTGSFVQKFTLKTYLLLGSLLSFPVSGDTIPGGQTVPSIPLPFFGARYSDQLLAEERSAEKRTAQFYEANEVYRQIALGVMAQGTLSSQYQLRGARFNQEAFRRSLLPQITPAASVDDQGNLIGRLQIEQVVFDSGRSKAGRKRLTAEQQIALADYVIQANERIAQAIDVYFRLHRAKALTETHRATAERYAQLQSMAERRLAGGVGSRTELGLFELRRLEADSNTYSSRSEVVAASAEMEQLVGHAIDSEPPLIRFSRDETHEAPAVARAIANSDRAFQELKSERADRLPRVSVQSSFGTGSSQGLGFNDRLDSFTAGVQLTRPLSWGRDFGLKAASAEAESARANIQEVRRDITAQLKSLDSRTENLLHQLDRSTSLINLAEDRVNGFEAQFLAGGSSIVEAVGTVDTFSRIQVNTINTRFELLSAQNEKSRLLGLLGPLNLKRL